MKYSLLSPPKVLPQPKVVPPPAPDVRQEQRVNNENIWGAWIDAALQDRRRLAAGEERVVVRNNVIIDDWPAVPR